MFRGDLFVTIAEIHTLILDVCVCQHNYIYFIFFCLIEKAKNLMPYKGSAAIIKKVNLTSLSRNCLVIQVN